MLHTIKLKAVVDESRQLHLQLPPETPAGDAEVIVTVTPATPAAPLGAGEIEAQTTAERAGRD
jgi:hypothetical protein